MGKYRKLLPQARQKSNLRKIWFKAILFTPAMFTFETPENILKVARSFLRAQHSKHFRTSHVNIREFMKHGGDYIKTKKNLRRLLKDQKTGPEAARIMLAAFPKEMEDEREALASKQQISHQAKKNQLALVREPFLGQWIIPIREYCGYHRKWSDVRAKIISLTPNSVVIQEEISREEHRLSLNSSTLMTNIAEGQGRYCTTRILTRNACERLIELTQTLKQSFTSTDIQSIIREYTLP